MSGKYALIIGNTEYNDSGLAQLSAPGKDAEDFARVLESKDICGFDDVKILVNHHSSSVIEAIDEFFDQKKPDDMLVLYFSGHGVKDEIGSLYLAFKNTVRSRLRSTAIKSDYIREAMDQSRSKRQVLILDCCNSGAFPQGTKAETGGTMGMTKAFQGYGRFVLTASDATQFAWEGDQFIGETDNSLFTHFLVKGLEGEADSDGDGKITVDELYDFAYQQISKVTPKQIPTKSSSKQEGEIVLRQNMRIEDIKPIALSDELINEIEDTRTYVREVAVRKLEKILKGKNIGLARSAKEVLERIAKEDDSRRVSQAATQTLESSRQVEEERRAREETERLALLKVEEDRLASEKSEAKRKVREEAEKLVRAKDEQETAERQATRLKAEREVAELATQQAEKKAAKEKVEKENAEREADRLKAEQEATYKKDERDAAQKAERETTEKIVALPEKLVSPQTSPQRQPVLTWVIMGIIGLFVIVYLINLGRATPAPTYPVVTEIPVATEVPAMAEAPAAATEVPVATEALAAAATLEDCVKPEVFCVGLVTDVGKVNDKSFNQSAWEGVQQSNTDGVADLVQFIETADAKDYAKNIATFGDAGFDVVVTVGFGLGEATAAAALTYPDIKFVGVDQFQTWPYTDDAADDVANLTGLNFPEDNAGFLVGALASMMSESHVIGAVCGTDVVPPVWRFGEGYKAGAAYADGMNSTTTEVQVIYHSDVGFDKTFTDPEWGAQTAKAMMDNGADSIFGCGGLTGNGAITAAAQAGKYAIGVDADQYLTLPEAAPRMLSSAMKLITPSVAELIAFAKDGSIESGNFVGQAGYAPFHDLDGAVSAEVKAAMEAINTGLLDGTITTDVAPAKP